MRPEKQNLPMVSLILPVFNVARYLAQCLDSLIAQDCHCSLECILIEDCSTDESRIICQRYAAQYPELFQLLVNEKNAGVSISRNRGLDRATGRYVMFVDPDDLLPTNSVRIMVSMAEDQKADIVKGNLTLFNERYERLAPDSVKKTRVFNGDDVLTALYSHDEVRGHVGGKLMRGDLIGGIRFTNGVRMAQDLLFFCEVFSKAQSLTLINKVVYRYRKHGLGSTGGKYRRGSYVDWLNSVEQCGRWAETDDQLRAHRSLMVRTLTQIARECRNLDDKDTMSVVRDEIQKRVELWNIKAWPLLLSTRPDLSSFGRYLKFKLALNSITRQLGPQQMN
jgi:glycosyltransferase involved in cell wall biosynthesis